MPVRKYQERDRDQVTQLWTEVFNESAAYSQPNSMLNEKLAVDDLVFVAENNNQITGACIAGYDGHRGWLYSIAVSPAQRLAGTGRSLVDFAVTSLASLGCQKVNLQIRGSNPDAAGFYKKLGFQVEDRISMGCKP
ncbi:MAG: VCBS repeat-containing protein [Candidatus Azotimanducaceae bacterium]|jgi:VCBS repeat-containing protein